MTYFVPAAPIEDDDLDNALQALVTGITGLDPTLVRPRWQPNPPKQPEPSANWCAIASVSSTVPGFPIVTHLAGAGINDQAGDLSIQHEEIEALASFYGPNAKRFASVLRQGLTIAQNLEVSKSLGLYFVEFGPARIAPDFINQQWVRRWDCELRFRRMSARVYGIPNIVSAEIDLQDDTGHVNRVVNVPPSGR